MSNLAERSVVSKRTSRASASSSSTSDGQWLGVEAALASLLSELNGMEARERQILVKLGYPVDVHAARRCVARESVKDPNRQGLNSILAIEKIHEVRQHLRSGDTVLAAYAALVVGCSIENSFAKRAALARAQVKGRRGQARRQHLQQSDWQRRADALKNRQESKSWAAQQIVNAFVLSDTPAPSVRAVRRAIKYP